MARAVVNGHEHNELGPRPDALAGQGHTAVAQSTADFTLSPAAEALAEALSWVITPALIYGVLRLCYAAAGWEWGSFQLSCILFGVCAAALCEGRRMAYLVAWAACFLTGLWAASKF